MAPDLEAARTWLRLLYGDDPDPDAGYLNIWTDAGRTSHWFPVDDLAGAARKACALAARGQNAYYGVGLRDRAYVDHLPAARRSGVRGASGEVSAIPALWADVDVAGPAHKETALPPTLRDALALVDTTFPPQLRPSRYILSPHGVHAYWLLAEPPWRLETEEERRRAASLLRRLQRTLRDAAARRRWKVDPTADLARVLRPPGTLNVKPGLPAAPVRVLEARGNGLRFNPHDFLDWDGLADDPETETADETHTAAGDFLPAHYPAIRDGCAFIAHCEEDAAALPEPHWYAQLGIVGRCAEGVALAHRLSRQDPRYTAAATTRKLAHAVEHGPATCATVADGLGFAGCRACPHAGRITSPISLGDTPIDREGNSGEFRVHSGPGVAGASRSGKRNSGNSGNSGQGSVAEPTAWVAPEPLASAALPTFPLEALPGWLRVYVGSLAEATQTPPDLAALMSLGVLSSAAGGRVKVWVRSTWHEPVNLYLAAALESGNRKSGVVRHVTSPLREWERRRAKERQPDVAAARSRRRVAEQALEQAEARAAKESDPGQRAALLTEAEHLARRLEGLPVAHPPRVLTEDVTPERLAGLLAEQGGRMAILSAEGDVFDIMAGRYSSEPNFGIFLKGHAGDPHHVDRQGRPAEVIPEPALTIAVSPQPTVLGGLAEKPSFRGRGLLARFLYALPVSLLGRRSIHPPELADAVQAGYDRAVLALLERFHAPIPTDGGEAHHYLKPDAGALAALDTFLAWVEPQLGPHGELAAVKDWGGKLTGAVVRLAALLHVADQPADPVAWKALLGRETMERAIGIGRYLIPHAQAAYDLMGLDTETGNARMLVDWICAKRKERFTKREAYHANKSHFPTVAALEPPLQLLEERGYIRREPWERPKGQRGQTPSPAYRVNPGLFGGSVGSADQNTQNTQSCAVPESGGASTGQDQNSLGIPQNSELSVWPGPSPVSDAPPTSPPAAVATGRPTVAVDPTRPQERLDDGVSKAAAIDQARAGEPVVSVPEVGRTGPLPAPAAVAVLERPDPDDDDDAEYF